MLASKNYLAHTDHMPTELTPCAMIVSQLAKTVLLWYSKLSQNNFSFLEFLFNVRPSDFVRSILDQTCPGCIYHVVGLCFKLLMRLSYYIHLGFGEKLFAHMGD